MLELLQRRRSIRRFLDRSVEAGKIEALLEAALRSPSSRGRQPWSFIVVSDGTTLRKLSLAKAQGSTFLAGAPLAVVVAGDPQISDVWIEDCSIAAIILQLEAQSLGLGSCWVQIRDRFHGDGRSSEEVVRQLFGLPDHLRVLSIIGLGYPADRLPGHAKEKLPFDRVHFHEIQD